jgi:hypothetical protein
MLQVSRLYLPIVICFLTVIMYVFIPTEVYAQDDNDPVSQVRTMVEEGEKNLEISKKRRIKRSRKKQLKYLKIALKSFSDAHRMIIGLQLDDDALKQAVADGLTEAHSQSSIQKEMKNLTKKLTKALSQKECQKSYDYIEELHNLDARSESYTYMSRVIAKLCPPTSP